MAKVKSYTVTLDAQELQDVIEAVLGCQCQNAQIANGLKRKGLDTDAQKLTGMNERLMRVIKRMQEAAKETA